MSEALKYLLTVRPDAMQAYFDFVKKAEGSLDARTRAIISVITKIDNQTEKGFKQYLKRALNEGVSANELIDAIMVAFPTLGLSKIVWAMDILLQMDLPQFSPDNLIRQASWHEIVDANNLAAGETRFLTIDKKGFFVHKNESGSILIFDQRCPHQATAITGEALEDKTLSCPKHGWKFDITNGECIDQGDKPLKQLKHKIENNRLFVYL